MLIWSTFEYHGCACHTEIIGIIVVCSTWTSLKTRSMTRKGEKTYPLRFLQGSWKKSVPLLNGSGFQAKYAGAWSDILEAKMYK